MPGLRFTERDQRLRILLRQCREEAGLYQEQLAEKLGKPQSYVSKLESGDRKIEFLEVEDVCRALDLELREFVRRWEENAGNS